jgi:methionyl-tRNA synthetase
MAKLRGWLNYKQPRWSDAGSTDLLTTGHITSKPGLLFDKIEDEAINHQIEKLMNTKSANEAASSKVAPGKEAIGKGCKRLYD